MSEKYQLDIAGDFIYQFITMVRSHEIDLNCIFSIINCYIRGIEILIFEKQKISTQRMGQNKDINQATI